MFNKSWSFSLALTSSVLQKQRICWLQLQCEAKWSMFALLHPLYTSLLVLKCSNISPKQISQGVAAMVVLHTKLAHRRHLLHQPAPSMLVFACDISTWSGLTWKVKSEAFTSQRLEWNQPSATSTHGFQQPISHFEPLKTALSPPCGAFLKHPTMKPHKGFIIHGQYLLDFHLQPNPKQLKGWCCARQGEEHGGISRWEAKCILKGKIII